MFVAADLVVIGAGALGSTEILLRSRERGLPLSGKLGSRFSGNGDFSRSATTPISPSTASASAITTWASSRPSGRASPGSSTSANRPSWVTGS
jgi:hypothetical protein